MDRIMTSVAMNGTLGIPSWLLGVFICLFGSTLTALGLVLQKFAYTKMSVEQAYYRQPWWIFGFSIWIVAQLINFVAMALAPQVVLSCLGSWSLVCNIVIARLVLRETVSRIRWLCSLGLVVAIAVVIVSAPRPKDDESGFDAVQRGLSLPEFWVLSPIIVILVSCLHVSGATADCVFAQHDEPLLATSPAGSPFPSPGCFADGRAVAEARNVLKPVSWAATSAAAAGYTALCFKCVAQILADGSAAPWTHPETYAVLAGGLTFAPLEVHLMNLALRSGDSVLVVPVYFSLGCICQLTLGAVFFEEWKDFYSHSQELCFAFGVFLSLTLLAVMSHEEAKKSKHYEAAVFKPEPWLERPISTEYESCTPTGAAGVGYIRFGA